jgi:hypothetical protein
VTDYYLDASALVKRYVDEIGSAWVRDLSEPRSGDTVLLAEITLAEVAAALAAKQRWPRGITLEQRDRALAFSWRIAILIFCSYRLIGPCSIVRSS